MAVRIAAVSRLQLDDDSLGELDKFAREHRNLAEKKQQAVFVRRSV